MVKIIFCCYPEDAGSWRVLDTGEDTVRAESPNTSHHSTVNKRKFKRINNRTYKILKSELKLF